MEKLKTLLSLIIIIFIIRSSFKKSNPNSRGKAHWFAHLFLDGKLSYPSYVLLDENLTRLMIYQGYKQVDEMLGILLFFWK